MFVLSGGLFQVLRRGGVVLREIHAAAPDRLLARTRLLWSSIAILSPLVLALLSLAGYQYSAIQMFRRLFLTDVLLIGVVMIYFLLNRWLLVAYRRLAIERNRQRREAVLKEASESLGATASTESVDPDGASEVSLTLVNEQTQRLMRLGAGLCMVLGLWLIWTDVLPALGILRSVELWQNQIAATADGESAPWVTLADLLLAAAAGMLTLVSARNLPGLLEITILQRLPLDTGARYAASSVTRYLIAVAGTTISCWLIGIGWSSVQWLIAAMTVGLGFGLQEIFANFVSGLILLFERPIRVGDTVTVNDITGTVSRIRIRATTIVDWDNRELIVPNRAFVTDNLINWTLTNTNVRMILGVGIAYGSDTRKATEILYRVMHENPEVLADPEPVVIFKEFGDSSLNFEARVFVADLVTYRRLQHDLNMAIDDEFRKAGIEIAFPQRDLHLRSISAGVQLPSTDDTFGLASKTTTVPLDS